MNGQGLYLGHRHREGGRGPAESCSCLGHLVAEPPFFWLGRMERYLCGCVTHQDKWVGASCPMGCKLSIFAFLAPSARRIVGPEGNRGLCVNPM